MSPRDRAGFKTFAASIAPSAPPAPTSVWISSINKITFFAAFTSAITALMRSSNWPRYFVPATMPGKSSEIMRLSARISGVVPLTMDCARPSMMAVLPTPGSPNNTGLFFVRRDNTCTTRDISLSRPMTGSSSLRRQASVKSRPKPSRAGVFVLLRAGADSPSWCSTCGMSISASPSSLETPPINSMTDSRTSSRRQPMVRKICGAMPSFSRSRASSKCSVPT